MLIEELTTADRPVLDQRWVSLFDHEPPAKLQASLVRRVLVWHAQMAGAGLKPGERLSTGRPAVSLRPGTRLLREWQGSTHEVLVTADGFEHAGKTYQSLSAIARAITGTRWSGPAFFGVKPGAQR